MTVRRTENVQGPTYYAGEKSRCGLVDFNEMLEGYQQIPDYENNGYHYGHMKPLPSICTSGFFQ
jgi:hypothetical protein